jgi:uncharacterized protein (TIGR02466 family)
MERQLKTIFPSVVQISEVEDSKTLNRNLLQTIEEIRSITPNARPESWVSSVYTTLNSADRLHEMAEFAPLRDIILREACTFADTIRLDHHQYPLRISDCWVNVYGPKDGQEVHLHANNLISGSYYVKAPPGSSGLMFHSPMDGDMLAPPYTEMNALNSMALEMPVQEGMIVLFRSNLRHSVRPSATDDERISVSFNLAM